VTFVPYRERHEIATDTKQEMIFFVYFVFFVLFVVWF